MGTRVDLYIGRGAEAEWLGSYPFDGYPRGVFGDAYDNGQIFTDKPLTEQFWRNWVRSFLAQHQGRSTTPDMGWPWPWEDSGTTDYAYAWDPADGVVYGSNFGRAWFRVDPLDENWGERLDDDESAESGAVFPDMTTRKNVTYGPRSGLIILGGAG